MNFELVVTLSGNPFYRNEDFVIAPARVIKGPESIKSFVTIKGDIPDLEFETEYLLFGSMKEYKGRETFSFNTASESIPISKKGIVKYLAKHGKGCGVGDANALKIFERFKGESTDVCIGRPEEIESLCRITKEQAEKFASRLYEKKQFEKQFIALNELFSSIGIGEELIREIISDLGAKAHKTITSNPFCLMQYKGIGFDKCDNLFMSLGCDPSSIERQLYAGINAMENDRTGSTWLDIDVFVKGVQSKTPMKWLSVEKSLSEAIERRLVSVVEDNEGKKWIAFYGEAKTEERLAEVVAERFKMEGDWPSLDDPRFEKLSDHQKQEVKKSFSGRVSILTGLAGTGKSFSMAPIISWAISRFGEDFVDVVAPAGKASVRVTEVLQNYGIENMNARTIHSLLRFNSREFLQNKDNKLDLKFLIVDEISFIPSYLLLALLEALPDDCLLLLTGDPLNQLPPVGRGAPIRDIMFSGASFGYLTEIQRTSGSVVKACKAVSEGRMPEFDTDIDPYAESPRNIAFIECPTAEIPNKMMELMKALSKGPFDLISDSQAITPLNEKTPCSVQSLNALLQEFLNPPNGKDVKSIFRDNDKVMCLKNSEFPGKKSAEYVANGDIGYVKNAGDKETEINFVKPNRFVTIRRKPLLDAAGCDIQHAYACTCHKFQGSEEKIIIITLDDSYAARTLMSRNWIGTAFSRTQLVCYVIGEKRVLRRAINNVDIGNRKTFLKERLVELTTGIARDFDEWKPGASLPTNASPVPGGGLSLTT